LLLLIRPAFCQLLPGKKNAADISTYDVKEILTLSILCSKTKSAVNTSNTIFIAS